MDMPSVIDKEKCVNCGFCSEICPLDVIKIEEGEVVVKYPDECWHCLACQTDCPSQAIIMRYPLSHMLLHLEIPKGEGLDWDD